jgi:hypothetical protein
VRFLTPSKKITQQNKIRSREKVQENLFIEMMAKKFLKI